MWEPVSGGLYLLSEHGTTLPDAGALIYGNQPRRVWDGVFLGELICRSSSNPWALDKIAARQEEQLSRFLQEVVLHWEQTGGLSASLLPSTALWE